MQPYLNDMEQCEQSPIWHSEGNVLIHSKMVLDEFEKMETELSENEKMIINHALLFHDISKPIVFSIEDGNIRAHGHERLSAKLAWELLEESNITLEDRREISNLVYYHGKPVWVHEKSKEEQEYAIINMSLDCRLDLLYYVTKSDFSGRICSDRNERLEAIEYFRMLAEELGCFNKPYDFNSDISKFKYIVERTHHHSDMPFNDTKSKVYMICGLPGSGKDTYIKKNYKDIPVISLDEIRRRLKIKPTDEQGIVTQEAKKTAKEYLAKGIDFVWNATNITAQMRQSSINIFSEYGAYITIDYIATPFYICLINNKNRDEKEHVPNDVMNKMRRKLEIPFNNEAHKVNYIKYNSSLKR